MAGPGRWGPPQPGQGPYPGQGRPSGHGAGGYPPGGYGPAGGGPGGYGPGGYGPGGGGPGGYGPGGYGPGGGGPGGYGPGGYGPGVPGGYGAPPPYGPPPGLPGGYGYVPPPRRRSGGGVRAVLLLGFLALIGVGGAMYHRATSGPAPVAAPAAPGKGRPAAASRLYAVGRLPSAGCRGRSIVQGDPRSFRRFLDSTSDCLDREWGQGMARAGIPFRAPQRVFWSTPGRSPCGDYPSPGVAAFYCPANTSMYIGVTDAQRAAGGLPVRYNVAYTREIAHEYGHAIQDMSGILDYEQRQQSEAATTLDRNAITKRGELQAQCLSGVFLNSVRATFPVTPGQWAVALRDSYGRGDDGRPPDEQDHGTDAHYRGWLERGFARGTTATCNTWGAPPGDVD